MERTGRSEADSKRVTVAIAQSAPVYLNKRDSALIVAGLASPTWKFEIESIACASFHLRFYFGLIGSSDREVCYGALLGRTSSGVRNISNCCTVIAPPDE